MKFRMMLAAGLAATFSTVALAQQDTTVSGYYRKNGTYVEPYHRTAPDNNPYNNYSTQGNVNPYTGQPGTVNPNRVDQSSNPYLYHPVQPADPNDPN